MTKEIQLTRPFGYNYTPRDCMKQYAREHPSEAKFVSNGYSNHLVVKGQPYKYDHWRIEHLNDHTDRVTLYLIPE